MPSMARVCLPLGYYCNCSQTYCETIRNVPTGRSAGESISVTASAWHPVAIVRLMSSPKASKGVRCPQTNGVSERFFGTSRYEHRFRGVITDGDARRAPGAA